MSDQAEQTNVGFPPVPDRNINIKEEIMLSIPQKSNFAVSFNNFSESCRKSRKTLLLAHCIICCFYWKLSAVWEKARIGWKGWKLVRVTRLASGWIIIEPSSNLTLRGFHQNMSNRQPVALTLLLLQNVCFVFCIARDVSYWVIKRLIMRISALWRTLMWSLSALITPDLNMNYDHLLHSITHQTSYEGFYIICLCIASLGRWEN